MGLELARAFITVGADASHLPADLQGVKSSVGSSMSSLAGQIGSVIGSLGATLAGAGMLGSGLQLAGQLEADQMAFDVMLGSAEEAKKVLGSLVKFAAETPFEMPEIRQVARGLVMFGERGDEMMGTLKMLGDASSGAGASFSMVGLIFNQIRGVGKLLTQDFRQLSTRGVLSLQDIADYYGVATGAAQEMLSSGRISFEDVQKIFAKLTGAGGRFENMMLRQSTTFLGLMSTLKDGWSGVKRQMGEGLMPIIKPIQQTVISVLDTMSRIIEVTGAVGKGLLGLSVAAITLGASFVALAATMRITGVTLPSLAVVWASLTTKVKAFEAALLRSARAMVMYPLTKISSMFLGMARIITHPINSFRLLSTAVGWVAKRFLILTAVTVVIAAVVWAIKKLWTVVAKSKILQAAWAAAVDKVRLAWAYFKDSLVIIGNAIVTLLEGAMGGTFEDLGEAIAETIGGAALIISEFALDAAEWFRVLADNWDLVWGTAPLAYMAFISYALDIGTNFVNSLNTIFWSITDNWGGIWDVAMLKFRSSMSLIWDLMVNLAKGAKAVWNDEAFDFRNMFMSTRSEELIDKLEAAKKKVNLKVPSTKDIFKPSKETKEMTEDLDRTVEALTTAKRRLESEREAAIAALPGKKPKTPEEAAKQEAMRGRFGIPEIGRKIQESLMGKDSTDKKILGVAEASKVIEEKLLSATLEIRDKPTVMGLT